MNLLVTVLKIVLILIAVAYFTIAERKVMAAIQRRRGPNVVGVYGLLQPLADGLKLLVKNMLIPTSANKSIFLLAPVVILTLSLISWSVIPFFVQNKVSLIISRTIQHIYPCGNTFIGVFNTDYSIFTDHIFFDISTPAYTIILILALSSLNVYGIIISGWSSNSKYAFLGSLRSAAQMISYEVAIGLVLVPVIVLSGTLTLTKIAILQNNTGWFLLPLMPCFIIFFISMLAETNRTPFDLPEAEAELVAGYNVEYSSIIFAMFFLGEYSNMLLMSTLISILFCGGWYTLVYLHYSLLYIVFLCVKISFFCFLFILVRATLPRYKYNQLMHIGWKVFLPIALSYLMLVGAIIAFF